MPAIGVISINDATTPTPVAHAFVPVTSVPPTYRRTGVAGQAIVAQERLLVKTVMAKTMTGVNKVQMELVIPVAEIPDGGNSSGYTAPPAIAHEARVKVEFFLHQRSDTKVRSDLRVLLSNLLKDAQVVAAVDNLEQPY